MKRTCQGQPSVPRIVPGDDERQVGHSYPSLPVVSSEKEVLTVYATETVRLLVIIIVT
jgi:hypothetical protein